MKVAPNRVSAPLLPRNSREAALFAMLNRPKFDRVTTSEGEVITLAYLEVPLNLENNTSSTTVICAASLFNPEDGTPNRKIGRGEALKRLADYLEFGVVKRHRDGRSADHFCLELDKSELVVGWREKVAKFVVANTWIGQPATNRIP